MQPRYRASGGRHGIHQTMKATSQRWTEPEPVSVETPSGVRIFRATIIGVVLIAVAVRCLAARGDLWLDEIWSLHFAQSVSSFWEIVTRIHHDNNHILNTFLVYMLGEHENVVVYRLPALGASIASVILAGMIGRRWGRAEALIAVVLTGSSFLLIHYGTEARGYALVVLFALLSFYLMERYLDGCRWAGPLFGPAVVLGLLSHLIFAHAYVAMLIWSFLWFVGTRRSWLGVAGRMALCHTIPIGLGVLLYIVHVRHLEIGGGPVFSRMAVLVRSAALTLGAPEAGSMAMAAAAVALAVIIVGVGLLIRERSALVAFLPVVIALSPAMFLLLFPPRHLYVRYFLISILFFILLLCRVLGHLYRRGSVGRIACGVILVAVVAGNAMYTADLLRLERGQYRAALTYMVRNTPGEVVHVGSDHDFRNGTLIDFYTPRLSSKKRIVYHRRDEWPVDGPDWIIAHSWILNVNPPLAITDELGTPYYLERSFQYARLSGWQWFLYRRQR